MLLLVRGRDLIFSTFIAATLSRTVKRRDAVDDDSDDVIHQGTCHVFFCGGHL